MAAIDSITVGNLCIFEVDADPTVSGIVANLGDMALLNDGSNSGAWLKDGVLDTDWVPIGTPIPTNHAVVDADNNFSESQTINKTGQTTLTVDSDTSSAGINLRADANLWGIYADNSPNELYIGTNNGPGIAEEFIIALDHVDVKTKLIRNVVDPILDQDAATKKWVEDNFAGGGGIGDLPSILLNRSTSFALPNGSYSDISFDETTNEPNPTILEHDNTNTDRILFKESGLYMVGYTLSVDRPNTSESNLQITSHVRLNDTTILAHSTDETTVFMDGSVLGQAHEDTIHQTFLFYATANDFLSVQGRYDEIGGTSTVDIEEDAVFWAVKLQGSSGGGGGASSMDDLTDADTTTVPPSTGDHLEWDGSNWVPSSGGNAYTIFPVWAEDNSGLVSGLTEWSFGNGSEGVIGIPIAFDCELFAVSFNAETFGTSVSMDVDRNTVAINTSVFTANDQVQNFTPVAFSAGDRVGFTTNTVNGTFTDARVCAWFRVKASGMPDVLYTPNGVEAITTEDTTKAITLEGYGTGAVTGTETFGIAVDATGKLIERTIHKPETSFVSVSALGFSSTTFATIPGLSTTVSVQAPGTVDGVFAYSAVRSGASNASAQFRVVVNGDNGVTFSDTVSTFNDVGSIKHSLGGLSTGTYTVEVQCATDQPITINAGTLLAAGMED